MDKELARKLRGLADREEIWSVMVRYARGIDRGATMSGRFASRVCVVEKNFELRDSAAFPDVPALATHDVLI